jgi:hypothetical protein
MSPTNCSPRGFSKAISDFGYHIAAGFYSMLIEQVYGKPPTHWLHIAVEKEFPHSVSIYQLPASDIERGKAQARIGIARFADCLMSGKWPSYADEPVLIGLPQWARNTIDNYGTAQDAAYINAEKESA